ncbi:MAG: MFS transporter [Clostridia bacterium]|nr:MFS transporter [Clostridia bacterium]
MDQLKLLNFHKMIANFANNLVGAFVALIVFQSTGNLTYAMIYLVSNNVIRLILNLALRKVYGKYPQLFLLLRIFPIALYNIFIFVLDVNLIIGVIGVCVFNALDSALNNLSKEIIFNYSSLTQKAGKSSIGVTRLFEQTGTIVALLVGGYLLDINKTLVLIMSLTIYSISVIPLVIFYVRSRHQKTFNKDATSNAVSTLNKNDELKLESHRLTKKLLITYFIVYFSFAFVDLLQTSYSLYVFSAQGEFATAGILNAIFNCFYAIGFYVAGIINEKYDTTKLVTIASIIIAICVIALPFVPLDSCFLLVCAIYGLIAFSNTFISLFVLERMLIKSRIMACSNKALFIRETGCVSAYCVGYSFGFLGLVAIFIITGISMFAASIVIPQCEEKTRQNLVDYLQNNERINRRKEQKKLELEKRRAEKEILENAKKQVAEKNFTATKTNTASTKNETSSQNLKKSN